MKNKGKERFIEKSRKVHGDRYDYSKVEYIDSKSKVCIICPEHGEFYQTPANHVRGNGCPICSNNNRGRKKRWDKEEFIRRATEIHGDRYDYSKVEYKNNSTKVCIICPEHGEFYQTPLSHIFGKQGCPKCSGRGLDKDEIIKRFKEVHGDKYDYRKVEYKKMHDKVCIICPEHGEFYQTPSKHLLGQGCPECAIESRDNNKLTTEEFIRRSNIIHNGRYSYEKSVYRGIKDFIVITCPVHGDFIQRPNYHLNGHGCPICGNNKSIGEEEIKEYLKEIGVEYVEKEREIISPFEIDLYIPDYQIGIEFDGLYWHSDLFKEDDYHLNKTKTCLSKGVRLIHIFEDEWVFKRDIVKSMLKNLFNKTENKIYGRDCKIKVVDRVDKKKFLDMNHLQGDVVSEINLGLYYENELVSLMCFGKPRVSLGKKKYNDNEYELLRFCNRINISVVGGASKLFKHFIEKYKVDKITSYCDRRWSLGNMYEKLGFSLSHYSQPNYFYIVGNNRKNRFKYRKSELVKEGFDKSKTEREIMKERGINRIYDCGTIVYEWKKEKS